MEGNNLKERLTGSEELTITEKDAQSFLEKQESAERILIIGGGNGAEVIIAMLSSDPNKVVVGVTDSNKEKHGKEILGVKILGDDDLIPQLKEDEKFDSLIISITEFMTIRRKIYEKFSKQYQFTNVVHPSTIIDPGVKIGTGNVICANAHIGTSTLIGNNNFIGAMANVDHHNVLGSNCLIAPYSSTCGSVSIGDNTIIGTGVNIKNHINIGNDVLITSGSVIIRNVKDNEKIKNKYAL